MSRVSRHRDRSTVDTYSALVRSFGIDVGGIRRGHAAVLLDDTLKPRRLGTALTCENVAAAVRQHRPDVVAIDSPPRCGLTGGSRACERELLRAGIHSYPTPSDLRRVETHPFFAWMKEGFRVFEALAPDYPLFLGGSVKGRALEVFPHATAYVLGGGPEPPGKKRAHRRRLLEEAGIETRSLRTADEVDAALAAYTGWLTLHGQYRALGNPEEGVVVIPAGALPGLSISKPSRSSYG